jgi:PAS domain S-box-containing protein
MNSVRNQDDLFYQLDLFRTLLDQSNDAIEVVDPETLRFLDVNQTACVRLGYSREELLSMTVFDIDPALDTASCQRVREQLAGLGFVIMESVHRRKDGATFPVEVNMRIVRLDRIYCVCVARDITVRKRAQDDLRRSEESYRMFVAQSSEGIFRQELDAPIPVDLPEDDLVHHILHDSYMAECNDAMVKMYGLNSVQEFVGKRLTETLDPNDPSNIQLTRDFIRSGFRVLERESREIDVHGNPKIFLDSMIGIVEDGNLVRTWGIQRDVTEKMKLEEERKRAEEALRESEARERARAKELQTVLDVVPIPVMIAHDAKCLRITGNRAGYEQLRVPAGTNFSRNAPPEDKQSGFRLMQDGAEIPTHLLPMPLAGATGKAVYGQELTLVFEDGTEREMVVNAVPLQDEEGKPRGVVGTLIDLTERKWTEKALQESERRLRAVYERSPVGIVLVDSTTGRFLQVNRKFCEITGRREEELLRSNVESITHPDDLGCGSKYLGRPPEEQLENYEMEKRYVRQDGSVCWVRVLVVPMWSKGEKHRWHMALVQDISERRQMEEAVSTLVQVRADSSENFFTSMACQLAKCLNADGTLIGELIEGEKDKVRTLAVCNQGVIADNFTYDLADTPCEGVLGQGVCSYISGATEMFPKDVLLKELNVEGYVGAPLRDSEGRVIGIMVAVYRRPLTDAKFAEAILQLFSTRTAAEIKRKRAEQLLHEAQTKLAHVTRVLAMGELVTSIAHEVTQPLTAIMMTSNFVLRQTQDGTVNSRAVHQAISEVAEDATRISDIISRIRTLVKKDALDRAELNINYVIQEATVIVRHEAAQNEVHMRLDLASNLPGVLGDRVQLQQVLINLAINGIDAMRTVGDRPRELVIKSAEHAECVLIEVQDSGIGLSSDRFDRIFEPFFTTKPQGIGMGLSISRSIIESHGGRLWTEPSSHGAIFKITLPANRTSDS